MAKTRNITVNAVDMSQYERLVAKAARKSALFGIKVTVSSYVRMLIDKDLESAEEKLKVLAKGKWRVRK